MSLCLRSADLLVLKKGDRDLVNADIWGIIRLRKEQSKYRRRREEMSEMVFPMVFTGKKRLSTCKNHQKLFSAVLVRIH